MQVFIWKVQSSYSYNYSYNDSYDFMYFSMLDKDKLILKRVMWKMFV